MIKIKLTELELNTLITALETKSKLEEALKLLKAKKNQALKNRIVSIKELESANQVPDEKIKLSAELNRQKLIENQTPSEKLLKAMLKVAGIEYRFQHIMYYKKEAQLKYFIVDFFIPRLNLVLEADGGYHKDKEVKKYDANRTFTLKKYGGVNEVYRLRNDYIDNNESKVLNLLAKIKELKTLNPLTKGYSKRKVSMISKLLVEAQV